MRDRICLALIFGILLLGASLPVLMSPPELSSETLDLRQRVASLEQKLERLQHLQVHNITNRALHGGDVRTRDSYRKIAAYIEHIERTKRCDAIALRLFIREQCQKFSKK